MKRILLYALVAMAVVVGTVVGIGYALPQAHTATVTSMVAASQAEVFARISDPARYAKWRTDISTVEVLSMTPLKWREQAGGDIITYEVVESRPPDRHVTRIADPDLPFGGTWTYELRADGRATHVTITERGEVYNPVFRFISRFFMSPTASMEGFITALQQSFGG